MEGIGIAAEKEGTTYWLAKLFVYGFMVYIAATIIWGAAFAVWALTSGKLEMADMGAAYQFRFLIGSINVLYEYIPGGEYIVSEKVLAVSFTAFVMLARYLPFLVLLNYIRKLLYICETSYSPFVAPAAVYVKRAGIWIIIMGVFSKAVIQFGTSLAACRQLYVDEPLDYTWIFAGIVLLIVSDIFERGCTLQQESDETL